MRVRLRKQTMRFGLVGFVAVAAVTVSGLSCRSERASQPPPPPSATDRLNATEPPPAMLELTAELPGEEFYRGDPLPVTVRLVSPRTRRDAYRRLVTQLDQPASPDDVPPVLPGGHWPEIAPDWQKALRFTLLIVAPDGRQRSVEREIDWATLLLPEPPGPRIGSPTSVWLVPPGTNLPAAGYLLQLTWDGRGLAEPADLPHDGLLRAELAFELIEPRTNDEKAVHLQRTAEFFYSRRDFARARELGRQAIELAPDALNRGLAPWLMIADCSTGLRELEAAIDEYRHALTRLPEGSERGEFIRRRIEILTDPERPARPEREESRRSPPQGE
jgi:hypothetical protein